MALLVFDENKAFIKKIRMNEKLERTNNYLLHMEYTQL